MCSPVPAFVCQSASGGSAVHSILADSSCFHLSHDFFFSPSANVCGGTVVHVVSTLNRPLAFSLFSNCEDCKRTGSLNTNKKLLYFRTSDVGKVPSRRMMRESRAQVVKPSPSHHSCTPVLAAPSRHVHTRLLPSGRSLILFFSFSSSTISLSSRAHSYDPIILERQQ